MNTINYKNLTKWLINALKRYEIEFGSSAYVVHPKSELGARIPTGTFVTLEELAGIVLKDIEATKR